MAFDANYSGNHLLIVEDGYFLDEETKLLLVAWGVSVTCLDQNQAISIEVFESRPNGAVIDIEVLPEVALSISENLEELDIPFVFATSQMVQENKPRFQGFRLCADPTELNAILATLFAKAQLN